jgi:predicted transcriptional regulator
MTNFKARLKALIAIAGMTQSGIAEALGCTQANIHYHLNNKASNPRTPASLVERVTALESQHQAVLSNCKLVGAV